MSDATQRTMTALERALKQLEEPCANCGFPTDDVIGKPKMAEVIASLEKQLAESREENIRQREAAEQGQRNHTELRRQRDELGDENTRLLGEVAALRRDVTPSIELETELECISDVATGRRPPEDFEPARGVLGEVIAANIFLEKQLAGANKDLLAYRQEKDAALLERAAQVALAIEDEITDESVSLGSMLFEIASRIRALSVEPRAAPSEWPNRGDGE